MRIRLALLGLLALSFLAGRSAAQTVERWSTTGSMTTARSHAVAVRLLDGRVLVVGGQSRSRPVTVLASAELYEPATGTWNPVQSMSVPRTDFAATRLADGRVLVAGGSDGTGCLSSAELFDPRQNTWSSAGSMTTARCSHTATLLNDGRVLVVGGYASTAPLATAELYDPGSNTWRSTDPLRLARSNHTATLERDGKVLVAGGFGATGPLNSVEVYDPSSETWIGFLPLPPMFFARYDHTATLLADGRVLVAGGFGQSGPLATAELYDPNTGFWVPARNMTTPRGLHTATLLGDGQVLVAGGMVSAPGAGSLDTSSTELYDPRSDTWSAAGNMATARYAHMATLLTGGQVLVAGGSSGGADLSEAELYTPAQLPSATVMATPTATSTPPAVRPATPAPTSPGAVPVTTPQVTATPTPTATLKAPTVTPASGPKFRIDGVRVERYGSPPDWRLKLPSLKRAAVGAPVRLSVYATFTARFGASHVSVTAQVTRGGRMVYKAGAREDRSGAGRLWDHWAFTPPQPGSYVFAVWLTVAGRRREASTSFHAVKRSSSVSFTFDRLETLNAKGRPARSFTRTERVFLVATLTIRGASAPVQVAIGQTLEYASAAGWRQLGQRVENTYTSGNGTHQFAVSFVPQTPYSQLRMVVDATVGSRTQRRAAVFEVHG